ncbi:MAG: hypothetical protein R3Y38_01315 [Rikenellaceae bacterium]
MEAIEKLIYNALVAGEGINLPKFGSLSIENAPSGEVNGKITAPYLVVKFSSEENESYTSVTALMQKKKIEKPVKTFATWLKANSKGEGDIKIKGVGVVKAGVFSASAAFAKVLGVPEQETLTPEVKAPELKAAAVKATAKKKNSSLLWLIIVCVLVLGVVGFFVFMPKFQAQHEEKAAEVVAAPVVETVAGPEPEPEPVVVEEPVLEVAKPFHVIIASCMIKANAESFVKANPSHELIEVDEYRTLISAAKYETLTQAWNAMETMKGDVEDVWVYELK